MLRKLFVLLMISLMAAGSAAAMPENQEVKKTVARALQQPDDRSGAKDDDRQIPEQVTNEHWAYKQIAELVEKYAAEKKLPEGRFCTKEELVDCLIGVLAKVLEKYDKEGSQGIQLDDLESIRTLQVSLESKLEQHDAYRNMRWSINQILTLIEPSEAPFYRYKVGVNGFLRGEGVRNFRLPDANYTPGDSEGRFLYRVKPYVYWHPNNYLDIHFEGQGYGYVGGNQHLDEYSLYQGFVEAKSPDKDLYTGRSWVALKAGRQEFVYGSSFILGADTFFNGLTFDAVRLRVQPQWSILKNISLDLLAGRYAPPSSEGIKGNLAGGYLTYAPAEDSAIEAYFFRDTGSEDHHEGERLDIYGFRSTSAIGIFGLEYEAVYETGRLFNPNTGANDNINAYGGHVDLTGEFKVRNFDTQIFMSVALGSGDKDAANGISSAGEFRNPNNDTSLVGDMSVVGDLSGIDVGGHHASGMQVYTLGWGIDIPVGVKRNLNFTATGRKFVADSVEDGISRDIGLETDFTLTYTMNKDLSLILGYDRFFTGQFFRDASGSDKDIDYGYAMLVFNYDRTKRIQKSPKAIR